MCELVQVKLVNTSLLGLISLNKLQREEKEAVAKADGGCRCLEWWTTSEAIQVEDELL